MTQQPYQVNKPLPQDHASEAVSIGGILIDNKHVEEVRQVLKESDYSHPFHKSVMEAVFALFAEQQEISAITIIDKMKAQGKSVIEGDLVRVANLAAGLPFFRDLSAYISIIKDKSLLRQMIKLFSNLIEMALSEEYTAQEILDYAEKQIFDLRDTLETNETVYETTASISARRIVEITELKAQGKKTGLTTHLIDADLMTAGLQKGDLIITGGRPSHGKSSLLLDEVKGIHDHLPKAVSVIFSCEMSKELCSDRILCQSAQINLQRYRNGDIYADERTRIQEAMQQLDEYKIIIIDETKITPLRMRYHLNRIADKYGRIDFAGADYAELMRDDKVWNEKRDMLGAIAEESKAIAKDYGIPLDLLSQLNRDCEKRNPPKPIESDLAGSDQLGRHADVIRFTYREWMYKPTPDNKELAELLYRKNRNGATGTVKVGFLPYATHFRNLDN